MPHCTKCHDASLLLLRLIVGAIFLYAGYAKLMFWGGPPEGMPMPTSMLVLMQFLSIVEPLGGIALLVGLLTRWAAAGLGIIMVGAVFFVRFTMHSSFFTGPQGTGLDFIVLIFSSCLVLMAFGAGRWSVDAMRAKV